MTQLATYIVPYTFVVMTSLDERLRDLVHAHLVRTGMSGRCFGHEALGDPGFAASLKRGRRLGLGTADRVLVFMGHAPIGPAFRRETEAFLRETGTKAYVLGEQAAGDPGFVDRLRRGASFRLTTVDRVRAWMAKHADAPARAAMRAAVEDAPLLHDEAASREPTSGDTEGGETGNAACGKGYVTTRRAAAFLGLSPRTLDRLRSNRQGPSYYRFGTLVRYRGSDLEGWAERRRVETGSDDGGGAAGRSP